MSVVMMLLLPLYRSASEKASGDKALLKSRFCLYFFLSSRCDSVLHNWVCETTASSPSNAGRWKYLSIWLQGKHWHPDHREDCGMGWRIANSHSLEADVDL